MMDLHLLAAVPPAGEVSGSWAGLAVYITIAIGFSFLCSMCEAVLLTSSLSYLQVMEESGKRTASMMLKFKKDIERPIAAVLTLNTIAHTVGAAGAGAQAAAIFGSAYVGVISGVLTLLILVFSEVIPKTVGAAFWKKLIGLVAWSVQLMVWCFYPLVRLFEWMTSWMTRDRNEPSITRSELVMMAAIGTFEGTLEKSEENIIRNLLELKKVRVSEIMTPRTVILSFPAETSVGDVLAEQPVLPYSRIPIYDEKLDDATAFVLRSDILSAMANDEPGTLLSELSRPLETILQQNTVAASLREFTARGEHIFLVADEYSAVVGLITLEDAIESLIGLEITDESDVVADLRALAKSRHERKRGQLQRRGGGSGLDLFDQQEAEEKRAEGKPTTSE